MPGGRVGPSRSASTGRCCAAQACPSWTARASAALESAEGSVVLGVLNLAEALIFVTDASQELTRAEITFLQTAQARCPKIICVVTKTDLHAEWRRIVELDRGHLADAGLDVPLVPVSSFLRMRAAARWTRR